MDFIGDV